LFDFVNALEEQLIFQPETAKIDFTLQYLAEYA